MPELAKVYYKIKLYYLLEVIRQNGLKGHRVKRQHM